MSTTKIDQYAKDLTFFGLSNEEARVYLYLLRRGKNGDVVGQLKNDLEIGRTTIYAILERLTENGWVKEVELSKNPRRVKYVAKTPFTKLNKIIDQKENELNMLKEKSLFIGDILDKIYQGPKNLTINTIHVGSQKYLKPLISLKWKVMSEVIERSDSLERTTYDYELKGRKGFPKDAGLIIFEYKRNIEKDDNLIQGALSMYKSKTEYTIKNEDIPGFEDIKFEDTTFGQYPGAKIYIKTKIEKNWSLAGHEAVIPLKNKIFLIYGNEINFQLLMEIITSAENFRHLI